MMRRCSTNRATLTQYLIETAPPAPGRHRRVQRPHPRRSRRRARASRARSRTARCAGRARRVEGVNVQGEEPEGARRARQRDLRAHDRVGRRCLAAWPPRRWRSRAPSRPSTRAASTCWSFDPLDGSSNIDVERRRRQRSSRSCARRDPGEDPIEADFLQPGAEQVAAGYAIYGPSTMLVLTVGHGVVGFTLDPELGDFFLTHPDIRVPERDAASSRSTRRNSRFWEPPVKRYVEECLAGHDRARAARTSTCAGSPRSSPRRTASSCAAACSSTRATRKDPTQAGPAAAALRVQPDRHDHRAGRRPREHRRDARPRRAAHLAAPAHRLRLRLARARSSSSSATTREPLGRRSRFETPLFNARGLFRQPRLTLDAKEATTMSEKHPIIAITGVVRRRHHDRAADLRADLPPRGHQRRRRRGRQLPPLRPRTR